MKGVRGRLMSLKYSNNKNHPHVLLAAAAGWLLKKQKEKNKKWGMFSAVKKAIHHQTACCEPKRVDLSHFREAQEEHRPSAEPWGSTSHHTHVRKNIFH
jgi:hypothetical protein